MIFFSNLHFLLRICKPIIKLYITANKCDGTSASAIALAWSAEWDPIYPKDQAAAALIKSSGSLIKASFNGAIPIKYKNYLLMQ